MTETRSWRRVLLPVSLVLNLFLVALIGGHLLRHQINGASQEAADSGMPLLARALAAAEARLSAPDAAAFDAVVRRGAPHYKDAGIQLRLARDALERQITAEPFDQEAVRQAFAAWQTSWDRFVGDISNTLIDALAQVSPEGRHKLIGARRQAEAGHAP